MRHRQTKEIFAVKRSRRGFRTKLQRERCLREILAVAALPAHSNIVGQYRAWQEGGHFYIQMDYCEGGSLNQLIHSPERSYPLSTEALWKVAADVATGLAFLHANNVLHLDIKPENLYRNLDQDGYPCHWRIGDFGLAVAKDSKDWEEGDGDFVAPELLQSGCDPSPAADVFSLGATLYECATGEKLHRKESSAEAAEVVLAGRPESFQVLVNAMLLTNPGARPWAGQVAAYAKAFMDAPDELCSVTPEAAAAAGPISSTENMQQRGDSFTFAQTLDADAVGGGTTTTTITTTIMEEQQLQTTPSPLSFSVGGVGATAIGILSSEKLQQQQSWIPSLSPLLSEGALTPGAAAGLMGLTPPTGGLANNNTANNGASAQRPLNLPPLLNLPPQQVLHHPPSTNRTIDTNPSSFRLHRRDEKSPGSEFIGSASESDPYSFSCEYDTTGSASDFDFPDTAAGGGCGVALSNARRLSSMSMAWEMHTSQDWRGKPPPSRSPTPTAQDKNNNTYNESGGGDIDIDDDDEIDIDDGDDDDDIPSTHTASVPHSVESSPSGSAPVSSRSCVGTGIPQFPQLDAPLDALTTTTGSTSNGTGPRIDVHTAMTAPAATGNGGGGSLSARQRMLAPGSATHYTSPFESTTAVAAPKPPSGARVVPPLLLPNGPQSLRRKRQHSSRRALVHPLKEGGGGGGGNINGAGDLTNRSVDLCSSRSLQELMPVRKGARRGGAFHVPTTDIDIGGGVTAATGDLVVENGIGVVSDDAMQPMSGHSTQRSARGGGQRSARVVDMSPCSAAVAAARMTNMTLDDDDGC